jgi:hypothetical protein
MRLLRPLTASFSLAFALCLAPIGILQAQQAGSPPQPQAPASNYDKALFQKPVPADQLTFLRRFDGAPAEDLYRDKQFRKLLKSAVPDCMFHYGVDTPLPEALDAVFKGSRLPVQIRDGRYLLASGLMGTHHLGRGFVWIDLQDGIFLGGFYFRPGNGEPTPTVNIFSKQVVKEDWLAMSQLPPAFADDFIRWSAQSSVSQVTPRYFITGSNRKILLEHDENFCAVADGSSAPVNNDCMRMTADAADIDMDAAYYLQQVNYATNATAHMITGPEEVSFIQVRDETCKRGPDPIGCHIRLTREQTHHVVAPHTAPHVGRR